jgi:flavin-dependent dehydrogenase
VTRWDAIVVGARCGGAPTAMGLARRGLRTLLLDRGRFPSDIMSTHFLKPSGVRQLHRWGLLPRVVASGCPPITTMTIDLGDGPLSAPLPPITDLDVAYAPRRFVLDAILVDAAVAAGVELREGVSVQDLVSADDRITGVRARMPGQRMFEERAGIVIGADGMRSTVARIVKAESYDEVPTLACWYYSYWSGLGVDDFRLYTRPGQLIIAFPTNDELTCILVGWPVAQFHAVRADIERSAHAALAHAAPDLHARLPRARRDERYVGTADVPGYFRKPFGPGWALVGDAGYHRDPSTGWGIADAFRDADLLVEAIAGSGDGGTLATALASYESTRNAAARPYYERTTQLAALAPPAPAALALSAALRRQPEEASRFMGAVQGSLSIDDYFAPDNIQRILAGT